jgi:hypothetical protein
MARKLASLEVRQYDGEGSTTLREDNDYTLVGNLAKPICSVAHRPRSGEVQPFIATQRFGIIIPTCEEQLL